MSKISVIIPAFNEVDRLPATLDSVYEFLSTKENQFEIVVVDDGSSDNTAQLVRDYSKAHPNVRVVSYENNRGKGYAVRTGMMEADGEYLIYNDADGSSPIEEIDKLIASIDEGNDIAFGSRAKPDEQRKVDALAYRKYIGNTFNLIVQTLILPGIHDTQCGFKMFRGAVAKDIFSVARIDGFAFDVEILYIGKLRQYKLDEVPINWSNVEGSKVNVFIDSPKMFLETLKISFSAWTGKYKRLIASKENETAS